MLEVCNVVKEYRGIAAVNGISFSVRPGEIVGYLGPNGAGKSTTVKLVTGAIPPTSGRVTFQGRSIHDDLTHFRSLLGYVPEEAHVYTHLSGLEYLQLIGRLRGIGEARIQHRATRLLEQLGLATWRHSPIGLYSKGMKQRVLIASALLHNPQLIVFDEPLSGLDVTTARLFQDLLIELARHGKAILYISHVLEVVEKVCSRVLILDRGQVLADASPTELCRSRNAPDLSTVFAQLVAQEDTRILASSIVQEVCNDAN